MNLKVVISGSAVYLMVAGGIHFIETNSLSQRGFALLRMARSGVSCFYRVYMSMNEETKAEIVSRWSVQPPGLRYTPATESQLEIFERSFGAIPQDFRWFLSTCGGGVVGSEWVDNISDLYTTHEKFLGELRSGGWSLQDTFIIGWDGTGNPFGIHLLSGAIIVEDHTFGGVYEVAPSFEEFLLQGLLTK